MRCRDTEYFLIPELRQAKLTAALLLTSNLYPIMTALDKIGPVNG